MSSRSRGRRKRSAATPAETRAQAVPRGGMTRARLLAVVIGALLVLVGLLGYAVLPPLFRLLSAASMLMGLALLWYSMVLGRLGGPGDRVDRPPPR